MTNRALAPEDVLGAFAGELTHRLYDAHSWDDRFACLDRILAKRMRDLREVPAGVLCAWHCLVASRGRARIGSVVQEVGWSQRHLIAQFTHELGVSPKVLPACCGSDASWGRSALTKRRLSLIWR
jgi:hypothetical protein